MSDDQENAVESDMEENFQDDVGFDEEGSNDSEFSPQRGRGRAFPKGPPRWSGPPQGGPGPGSGPGPRDGPPPRFRGRGFGPPPGMFRGGRGGPPPLFRGGPPPRGPPGFNGPPPNFGEGGPNWGPPGGPGGMNRGPQGLMGGPPPFGGPMMGPPGMNSGPNGPGGSGMPPGFPDGSRPDQSPGLDTSAEIWVETKTAEGKSYFYNARSRETTWNKPEGPNIKVISQDQVEAMAQAANTNTQPQNTSTAAQAALAQASITNKPEGKDSFSPLDGDDQKKDLGNKVNMAPPGQGPPPTMMGPPPGMPFGQPPGGFPPFGMPPFGLPPPGQGPPGWMPPGATPWGIPPGLLPPVANIPSALPAINEAEILSKIDPDIIAKAREWTEHKAPDGRFYYHHAKKGESVWEKPQPIKDLENAKLAAAQGISTKPKEESAPQTSSGSGKTSSSQANGEPAKEEPVKDKEAETKEKLEKIQEEIRKKKEEEEKEKEKKAQDKSRPVSSTPVPGTPWCVVWTGDGRVFFYNPSSRTSVWERPEELLKRTDVDKMVSTPPDALAAAAVKPESQENKTPVKSKRSSDDSDSDAETTPAKKPKVDVDLTGTTSNGTQGAKKIDIGKEAAIEAEVRAAKERAIIPLDTRISLFKEMLAEKQVSAFSTWEKELHKIVFDSRYLLLTSKERKQVFEKYVKERAEEERREKRNKIREKKEAFKKLLSESHLHGKSSFSDFAQKYAKDERFKGVDKMRERESLFNEHLIEVRRKEKEDKFQKREAVKRDFIIMLREHSDIDRHSHWSDVKRKVDSDPRYKAVDSHGMREDWFREYCKILKEEKRRRKEERERDRNKDKHRKRDKDKKDRRDKDKDRELRNDGARDEPMDEVKRDEREDGAVSDKELEDAEPERDSDDEKAKEEFEKERQAKAEASLKRREEEVQRTLATHMRDRDKEREQHKRDEARQHFNALLVDLVRNSELSWKEVKRILRKDHRWDLAESLPRDEKEKLFNEHVEALLKKKRQSFREMLDETPEVNLISNWKEIKKIIREDARYTKFASSERCEREFKDYLKDKLMTAKSQFKELLQETKLITHKSLTLLRENQNHMQEIEDILKNDKRFLILEHIPQERTQLILNYLEELDRRGPPPPPTASEPNRRTK